MTCRQPTFSALRSVTNPRQDRYMRPQPSNTQSSGCLQPLDAKQTGWIGQSRAPGVHQALSRLKFDFDELGV
jgi:hypothetical protein